MTNIPYMYRFTRILGLRRLIRSISEPDYLMSVQDALRAFELPDGWQYSDGGLKAAVERFGRCRG